MTIYFHIMSRSTIEIEDLDFGYSPSNPVLKNINHIFDTPEFICIMGPNGVGKSTLIHCINKILMIANGGIYSYGTPKEVLTMESILDVYGVDADIIDVEERPHVILNDSIPTDD